MLILDIHIKHPLATVAFNPTGKLLAGGGGGDAVFLWDTATGRQLRRVSIAMPPYTQALAFHPTAPWWYAATNDDLVAYNVDTDEKRILKLDHLRWAAGEHVGCLTVDPTGRRLLSFRAERGGTGAHILASTDVSDPDHPRAGWERPVNQKRDLAWAHVLAFFSDGERFASAETCLTHGVAVWNNRLVLRKADTGKVLHDWVGPGAKCEGVVVSPCGDSVVTRHGMVLYVFAVKDSGALASPRRVTNTNRRQFTGMAFHPSGRYLATTSNDATVKLYDATTWKPVKRFTWEIGKMRSVAFSPDGNLAAAGSEIGKAVIWDVDEG